MVRAKAKETSAIMAITVPLPKPRAKVRIVAPLVATPGQAFGMIAHRHITIPHGFQKREKPVMAVSPVAKV
jgi:hypothetical protein